MTSSLSVASSGEADVSLRTSWLQRLRNLNPNANRRRGTGKARYAPHKPLLLLSLIDLAAESLLPSPRVSKSSELRLRFDSLWSIVQERCHGKPDMDQPFFYLGTQRFWTPLTASGQRATVLEHASALELASEFWELLHDATFRAEATHILITTWFPDSEQVALFATFGFTKHQIKKLNLDLNATRTDGEIVQGRDARFRIMVVSQYRFTCALTGYGLHTVKGSSLVEAAHIHAFADSKDNSIGNGLALTRDAHWMFDEGLWTLSENNRVCVAKEVFTEWGPDGYWLKERDGCELVFEKGVTLRPTAEHCAWHRGVRFKGK